MVSSAELTTEREQLIVLVNSLNNSKTNLSKSLEFIRSVSTNLINHYSIDNDIPDGGLSNKLNTNINTELNNLINLISTVNARIESLEIEIQNAIRREEEEAARARAAAEAKAREEAAARAKAQEEASNRSSQTSSTTTSTRTTSMTGITRE